MAGPLGSRVQMVFLKGALRISARPPGNALDQLMSKKASVFS